MSGLSFRVSDHKIDRFYKIHSVKVFEAQKQRPNKLLLVFWFDKKVPSKVYLDLSIKKILISFGSDSKIVVGVALSWAAVVASSQVSQKQFMLWKLHRAASIARQKEDSLEPTLGQLLG